MQTLDTTIANVALPYMQGSLSATSDQINWVLTSYIVAAAIIMPATGWLEARFGRKPLFLTAVIGFIVTSMLCGAAVSLPQIVAFRLLQGIFGAPLVPLSQSVLLDTYRPEQQGHAMAVFGLGVMLGPILGPTLGGWLTDSYSWRWVFYVNVPIGVLSALGILLFLGRRADRPLAGRLDWLGFSTLGLGIGALQLFLDRGERLDWFASHEIQIEVALCVLGFYLFTVHTVSARDPFIDPALFRNRNFVIGIILIFIVGVVLLATLAMLTAYLEQLMNYPVLTAGLVLAPRGVGTMIAMLIVGQLIRYIDARLLIATGLGTTGFALYLMTGFTRCIAGHLDPHRSDARLRHRLRLRALEYDRVRHAGAGAAHTGNGALQPDAQYRGKHRHLYNELSVGTQYRYHAVGARRAHHALPAGGARLRPPAQYRHPERTRRARANSERAGGSRRLHRQFQADDARVFPGDSIGDPSATSEPAAWRPRPRFGLIEHGFRASPPSSDKDFCACGRLRCQLRKS
jgi:MFS family permease